jgi:pimeloyl-ACP methyl ester carboxylesterase
VDDVPSQGWRQAWIDVGGPVRYLDFGGPRGPVLVCVHGLGGSAVNWSAIAPLLTRRYRVLAPDLAGHGLTRSAGRGTDVAANRALLHSFITTVCDGPVILMGNSMGGMISLLEASAAPRTVAGLILVDPALPFAPARPDLLVASMFALSGVPGLGRLMLGRLRSLSPEAVVAGALSLCCADPSRVSQDVVAQHVELARQRASFTEAGRDMANATRSVIATAGIGVSGQAYRHAIRAVQQPVLVLHGERDRLVPASAARGAARANPSWKLVILPDAGHVPQLEVPADCAKAIIEWLGSAGSPAAAAAASRARLASRRRGRLARRPRWRASIKRVTRAVRRIQVANGPVRQDKRP